MMSEGLDSLFVLAALVLGLYVYIWLCFLVPIRMAKARNRWAVLWVLVSLFLSPFAAIIGLALLGSAS